MVGGCFNIYNLHQSIGGPRLQTQPICVPIGQQWMVQTACCCRVDIGHNLLDT